MFIVMDGIGDVLKSRRPTKRDPNPVPSQVARVKAGDVVGEICLLTGRGLHSSTFQLNLSRF